MQKMILIKEEVKKELESIKEIDDSWSSLLHVLFIIYIKYNKLIEAHPELYDGN